uniref:Uncharacterized protein n=1 Tax=Lactuca sativa TaxID=4236 RepID=A0A9R1VTG4_LACSA|nr:hypothetical protein LSAT_V11C400179390 [Lactuca sativa]
MSTRNHLQSRTHRSGEFVEEERRCQVAQESPQKQGKKCKFWEWIDEEPENMKPIVEYTLLDVADYLIQVLEDVTSVREEVKRLKSMICVLILLVIVKIIFWG